MIKGDGEPYACPDCTTALTPRPLVRASSSVCSTCRGVLVNAGNLRDEYGGPTLGALWERVRAESYTGKRSCPACRKPMRLFATGDAHGNFALDVCAYCKIFWFDSDELQRLGTSRRAQPRDDAQPELGRSLVQLQGQFNREQRELAETADLLWAIVDDLFR